MFLQTITVDDQWFTKYHGTPDWIEEYIFPGGDSRLSGEMLKSLARTTSLSAPLRTGAPAGRPHQHRADRGPERAPCRSTRGSSCTTTARIRISCGCSPNSAWPPATRTCRSPCRADGAGSSTAAAAPTGSSPSGAIWSRRRTSRCSARSCASIGRRPRCSRRRTRNARRWATFSSPAVSVRVSPIGICFPWRRPSGRPRSTRSDRFPRSRSSASSTTTGCSRSMPNRHGRSWPAAATPTFPGSSRTCRATCTRAHRFMRCGDARTRSR